MLPRDDGTWLRTLKAEVQAITFKTGREYAEGRRVSMLTRTAEGLAARVIGTEGEKYEVSLKPSVVLFLIVFAYGVSGYVLWGLGRRAKPAA